MSAWFLVLFVFLSLARINPNPLQQIVEDCNEDRNKLCPNVLRTNKNYGAKCMQTHFLQMNPLCQNSVNALKYMMSKQERFLNAPELLDSSLFEYIEKEFWREQKLKDKEGQL